jgi:hypothetical protein
VSREYLEMLHANHEDWLRDGPSLLNLQRGLAARRAGGGGGTEAGVLHPASAEQARRVEARVAAGEKLDQWQIQLIENVPEAIKDQVGLGGSLFPRALLPRTLCTRCSSQQQLAAGSSGGQPSRSRSAFCRSLPGAPCLGPNTTLRVSACTPPATPASNSFAAPAC